MKIKILYIYLLLFLPLWSSAEKIRFEQLGFEHGLNQISIRALYQDEKGIIWVGTTEGLKRYNGNNFSDISLAENTRSYLSTIQIICGDKRGHLYLKSNLNNVIEYNLQTGISKIIFNGNPEESVVITYGKNKLFIATLNRLYIYNNNKLNPFSSLSENDIITAISITQEERVYIGTHKSGLFSVDQHGYLSKKVSISSEIISIYEDSSHHIWFGTFNQGLFVIDKYGKLKQFTTDKNDHLKISSNYVRAICEDNYRNIWIGTINGLDKFNSSTCEISHIGQSEQKNQRLSHPSVWSLMKDNQGTIWVATFYGGINYFNPIPETFNFYNVSDKNTTADYPVISKIIEDNNDNLWIGTEGIGLVCFNNRTEKKTYYSQGKGSISRNIIKSLYYDQENNLLWIGTHLGGLNCLNLNKKKFTYKYLPKEQEPILSQSINAIVPYNNYLYLGTLAGIYRYNIDTQVFDQDNELKGKFSVIQDLLLDNNNLWIASNGLYKFNLTTKHLENFQHTLHYSNGTSRIMINDIVKSSKSEILLGTSGAGVIILNPLNNHIIEFNQHNSGLESNYISAIFKSKSGGVLVGTNKGFSYIDVTRRKCFNYNARNGFPLKSMMSGSIFSKKNGEIVLGGINGLCIFNEKNLINTNKNYQIRFDNLWINNRLIIPKDNSGLLDESMPYARKIVLNYQQKIIGIEVAADNYVKKNQINFQYKLEPFNKDWVSFDLKTPITFMNLPSGSYVLKVKGTILHKTKTDNDTEIALQIIIRPPLYATWYAYLFYGISILLISMWIVSFYHSRLLLKTSLIFERKDKEQKELANQSKLRFFTYVSHEFRTPLTLIIGQLELLMQSPKISASLHKDIINIHKNAKKLIFLINELLDFRKQEQGFMKLKVSNRDLVSFIYDIYVSYKEYAYSKKIKLEFESDSKDIQVFFDYVQLQKVFYNLISNAFKYVNENEGIIKIGIHNDINLVEVSIYDNGMGISSDAIKNIFEQFYQTDSKQNVSNIGTGLGLALSKGIVELHGGIIEVQSETGQGAIFVVKLLKGDRHFLSNNNVDIIEHEGQSLESNITQNEIDYEFLQDINKSQINYYPNKPTILIVEDDEDLRVLLIEIFSKMYNVLETNNGLQGYLLAKNNQPNLILSDIMMPEMDGNEMCLKLKQDFETCHIPIVLLTAQTAIEQNIDSLKNGADDFISKPFNIKILIMRCNNLLNSRKILQEKYSKEINLNPPNIALNSIDQNFIEKAVQIIENGILNKKITIDYLCSELAIGRRVFFDKMKSITGQTPNDFIMTVKFKIAAKLLKNNPELNISEISDNLGFSSPKYFGKCFKEHFGISPIQMRDKLTNMEDVNDSVE